MLAILCAPIAVFSLLVMFLWALADVVIDGIKPFSLVPQFWKTHDKYEHRALLVCFFGMFVAFPAYIFDVGYLLLPIIPRAGDDVFLGIMLVGALALISGLALLVRQAAVPPNRRPEDWR